MEYISTRGGAKAPGSIQAMLTGLAADGGLFIPRQFPEGVLGRSLAWKDLSYADLATGILSLFLTDFTMEELKEMVGTVYTEERFSSPSITPVNTLRPGLGFLELWHGPTCAFKDLALQLLPHLLVKAARKSGDDRKIILLVATSGDTGKAALEGFRDLPGTMVIVFYPAQGVSAMQKRQMLTQEGENTMVIGVEGNFDQAQTGVKTIFSHQELGERMSQAGMRFSSANSINWGRLIPQVVYYVWAYLSWVREGSLQAGEEFNVVVPTGNFGNILAAYYGKRLGLPIKKLICASNMNNVLTEFLRTGVYNRKREFYQTISPSMDILISSNLERLLFELAQKDTERVKTLMKELQETGVYRLPADLLEQLGADFWGGYATEEETKQAMAEVFADHHYLLDPHTAVGYKVYQEYTAHTGDKTPTVIASTASPYKFPASVAQAIMKKEKVTGQEELALLQEISQFTGTPIPEPLRDLDAKPLRHRKVVAAQDMERTVRDILFSHK